MAISPFDLSTGFRDAIEVMSQYLTQHRGADFMVVATCRYLTSLGLGIPTKPISEDDLVALSAIVQRCDAIRAKPAATTARGLAKFNAAVAQISPWLSRELGLDLDAGVPPNDVMNAMASDLSVVVADCQTEYAILKPAAFVPGPSYTRPPAPNEDYLDMNRNLDPASKADAAAIAGGAVSSTSEYWEPPPPTSEVVNDYGQPPPEAFLP